MYKRFFNPIDVPKSYFLLGPRQTGKSTLLKQFVDKDHYFDLLKPSLFAELNARPEALVEMIQALPGVGGKNEKRQYIVIDEIQKLPNLLDTVQYLIGFHKNLCFILTGSSARKLRKAGQNLLGGRARKISFCPLTLRELFEVEENPLEGALRYGGLPGVRSSKKPSEELRDYVGVYLNEEIMAEALVRNLNNFSRFLATASLCNAEQINYQKIAADAQVKGNTVRDYFDILEDTLIGDRVNPFKPYEDRKFVSSPKFYFFDIGVCLHVTKKNAAHLSNDEMGKALETLIYGELKAYKSYVSGDTEIFYWRTQTGNEVDFVLRSEDGRLIGIEVKMTKNPTDYDLKGLRSLAKETNLDRKILVCNVDRSRRTEDGCEIVSVSKFVEHLWKGM